MPRSRRPSVALPNTFAAIAAHGPAAIKPVLAADAVLAAGSLTKRDQKIIKLTISAAGGCDYCVAAHNTNVSPRDRVRSQNSIDTATEVRLREARASSLLAGFR
jgi:alkylhydroperoxidase family enzyme